MRTPSAPHRYTPAHPSYARSVASAAATPGAALRRPEPARMVAASKASAASGPGSRPVSTWYAWTKVWSAGSTSEPRVRAPAEHQVGPAPGPEAAMNPVVRA